MSKEDRIPDPVVKVPLRKELPVRTRIGRGFSVTELRAVGLDVKKAKKLGLKVDKRRASCHEENVKVLKEFLEKVAQEVFIEG